LERHAEVAEREQLALRAPLVFTPLVRVLAGLQPRLHDLGAPPTGPVPWVRYYKGKRPHTALNYRARITGFRRSRREQRT
jgi:hypothetical protein